MTAYPETCLVDREDGYRTVITIEAPSDADIEQSALAVLRVVSEEPRSNTEVRLSPEAAYVIISRLRQLCDDEGTSYGITGCPCCGALLDVSRGEDGRLAVVSESESALGSLNKQLEHMGRVVDALQSHALPSDCPDCDGSGAEGDAPDDGPCLTCGGWTEEKRARRSALLRAAEELRKLGREAAESERVPRKDLG